MSGQVLGQRELDEDGQAAAVIDCLVLHQSHKIWRQVHVELHLARLNVSGFVHV